MTPAQRSIIDQHAQIFPTSCPGSLLEMLLKVVGAIPPDCFDFQRADPTGMLGLGPYSGARLPGDYTLRRIAQGVPWEFPLAGIKAKLNDGVVVGIFENPPGGAHGWVIDEIRINGAGVEEIVLTTKPSEMRHGEGKITVSRAMSVPDAANLRWSDPVFVEKLPPSPGQ
jgi:hypothetical protein